MLGQAFLESFGGIADSVTSVRADTLYSVRAATLHPIYEHERVKEFARLLPLAASRESLLTLGELMFASHASYSACGLGSTGTDHLVRLVREAGPSRGLYGAKITGGGSGGTVAILADATALDEVRALARAYTLESGLAAHVFYGSSAGAMESDVLRRKAH
jgi:L-arabinokinase